MNHQYMIYQAMKEYKSLIDYASESTIIDFRIWLYNEYKVLWHNGIPDYLMFQDLEHEMIFKLKFS